MRLRSAWICALAVSMAAAGAPGDQPAVSFDPNHTAHNEPVRLTEWNTDITCQTPPAGGPEPLDATVIPEPVVALTVLTGIVAIYGLRRRRL